MTAELITVRARIRLLSEQEGGRSTPLQGGSSYRPNHNFFGPDERNMTVGFMDLPEGQTLWPGWSTEIEISFWSWPGLEREIYPGREWRIQEGCRLVGMGAVIAVLP